MIENTSKRDPYVHLLGAMSEGQSGYIEGMEAAGQRQVVNSGRLPTKLHAGTEADFAAVGIVLGKPGKDDPLFRPAALPAGWKREASDHSMWSYVVDQFGRRRVAVFFKGAFYDRDAGMSLYTPYRYLSEVLSGDGEPVLDDAWLTPEVAVADLEKIRGQELSEAAKADGYANRMDRDYWTRRAEEHRAVAAKAEAVRARVEAVAG